MVKIEKFKYKVDIPTAMFAPFRQFAGYIGKGYRALTSVGAGSDAGSIDTQVNSPQRSYSSHSNEQPVDLSRRRFTINGATAVAVGVAGALGVAGLAKEVFGDSLKPGVYRADDGQPVPKMVKAQLDLYEEVVEAYTLLGIKMDTPLEKAGKNKADAVGNDIEIIYNEILEAKKKSDPNAVVTDQDIDDRFDKKTAELEKKMDLELAGKDPNSQESKEIELRYNKIGRGISYIRDAVIRRLSRGKPLDTRKIETGRVYAEQVGYYNDGADKERLEKLESLLKKYSTRPGFGQYAAGISQDEGGFKVFTVPSDLLNSLIAVHLGDHLKGIKPGKFKSEALKPWEVPAQHADRYRDAYKVELKSIVPGKEFPTEKTDGEAYNAANPTSQVKILGRPITFGVNRLGKEEMALHQFWDTNGDNIISEGEFNTYAGEVGKKPLEKIAVENKPTQCGQQGVVEPTVPSAPLDEFIINKDTIMAPPADSAAPSVTPGINSTRSP